MKRGIAGAWPLPLASLMLLLLFGFALFATVPAGPALAQETQPGSQTTPALASLDVSLLPEYDRPEMLVIYYGQFRADTPLPLSVQVRIPAQAGQPSAVAYEDETGQLLTLAYDSQLDGSWLVVSFTLPTLRFQLEYYAPVTMDGDQRTFVLPYTADYPVGALNLQVQAPPTSQGLTLSPGPTSTVTAEDGLTYYVIEAGPLAQHEARSWTVTYLKPDSRLTVDLLNTATPSGSAVPAAPVATPAQTGGGSSTTVLIFLIAFVALVGVGAGAFWLGRRVQPSTGTARRMSAPEGTQFCHSCGAPLRPGARYCHVCRAEVKDRTP